MSKRGSWVEWVSLGRDVINGGVVSFNHNRNRDAISSANKLSGGQIIRKSCEMVRSCDWDK